MTDLVNLSGSETLTIKSINVIPDSASCTGGSPYSFYIKIYWWEGTSVGHEGSSAGWTEAAEFEITEFPLPPLPVEIPLSSPFDIPPGGRYGLYAVINEGESCPGSVYFYASCLGGEVQVDDTYTDDGTLKIDNAPGHFVHGLFGGVLGGSGGWPNYLKPQLWVTYEVKAQPPPVQGIPTLSEWGLILFSLLMATAAVVFMRKRNEMAA